ncbi:unnamed protein product [Boreogadus saida]
MRLCSGATPARGGGGETRTERRGWTPESQRTQAPPSHAPAYPNRTIADRRGPDPERGVEVLHVRPDGPPGPPLSRSRGRIHAHGQGSC